MTQNQSSLLPEDGLVRRCLLVAAVLAVACFVARAPTSFNGKIPLVGDFLPLELGAVYVVVFGPFVAVVLSALVWAEASRSGPRKQATVDKRWCIASILVVGVLGSVLSAQYFLILAPQDLCATRPHPEFLWTKFQGSRQMAHCMSGTSKINEHAPHYLKQQYIEAWGILACPLLTVAFLVLAQRAVRGPP